MITSVAAPEPHEEPETKTEAEVIEDYKVDRKQALENVANVASAAVTKGVLKAKMTDVATVVAAAAEKPNDPAPMDFDEAFKDFQKDTALLSAAYHNRVNLVNLGIDAETEDDTVFGAKQLYCGAHRRVHSSGWCTVRLLQKRPLKAEDRTDAIVEATALGLLTEDDK